MGLEEGYVGTYGAARMIGCSWLRTLYVASCLHVLKTGDISSTVIRIKKPEGCTRQRKPERFQPVAYADSEVGGDPGPLDRPLPQP